MTFIMPAGRRVNGLPSQLRVHQVVVYEALCWLQRKNHIYSDIVISKERLLLLPEDGVSMEIVRNVCESDDVDTVIQEHDGYVPVDIEVDQDGMMVMDGTYGDVEKDQREGKQSNHKGQFAYISCLRRIST